MINLYTNGRLDVIGKLAIKESLTKEEIKFAEDLGSTLANKVNQSC